MLVCVFRFHVKTKQRIDEILFKVSELGQDGDIGYILFRKNISFPYETTLTLFLEHAGQYVGNN